MDRFAKMALVKNDQDSDVWFRKMRGTLATLRAAVTDAITAERKFSELLDMPERSYVNQPRATEREMVVRYLVSRQTEEASQYADAIKRGDHLEADAIG
jgi:hypothetical protein